MNRLLPSFLALLALAAFLVGCSESDVVRSGGLKSLYGTPAPGAPGGSANVAPGGYAIMGPPTITAERIDKVLCAAGSPACNTGKNLYDAAVERGIDPVAALAFFRKESTYGTKGVARATKGLGNIRCAGWSGRCIEGFRAYDSWAEGYRDWANLISVQYVQVWKLTTVDTIVRAYAPAAENNTSLYIQQVEQYMDQFRQGGAA